MSRRTARETVFKLVFEYTFYGVKNDDTLDLFLLDSSLDEDDQNYIKSSYTGITEHYDELCAIIEKHSNGFALSRIYRPDLAVLLLGSYELIYCNKIPELVAINEAVMLAKSYGTEKSFKFVNGILASILNEKNGDNK
ncbi:MAG: transcription antitermination factor NusB [Clostridia bacterium]|nr:transcription antitermination factor NusB [Clostridia bacterium]